MCNKASEVSFSIERISGYINALGDKLINKTLYGEVLKMNI
jgi:hypothetical protein